MRGELDDFKGIKVKVVASVLAACARFQVSTDDLPRDKGHGCDHGREWLRRYSQPDSADPKRRRKTSVITLSPSLETRLYFILYILKPIHKYSPRPSDILEQSPVTRKVPPPTLQLAPYDRLARIVLVPYTFQEPLGRFFRESRSVRSGGGEDTIVVEFLLVCE
jgi:hypothetical protein